MAVVANWSLIRTSVFRKLTSSGAQTGRGIRGAVGGRTGGGRCGGGGGQYFSSVTISRPAPDVVKGIERKPRRSHNARFMQGWTGPAQECSRTPSLGARRFTLLPFGNSGSRCPAGTTAKSPAF